MNRTAIIAAIALVCFSLSLTVTGQSIVITKKTITYKRSNPMVDFKKEFTVNHPQVRVRTRALSRKIEAALSYKTVFGIDVVEETRDSNWLDEADFKVVYNKNGLLGVELWVEGSAAYPSGMTKNIVVDARTGNRVKPGEVFVYANGLVDMITALQKAEITAAIEEIRKDKDLNEPEPGTFFENSRFRLQDLTHFAISDKGIAFFYDYGFPHAIKAIEPEGKYTLTWAQLKPYIRSGGLLSRLVR